MAKRKKLSLHVNKEVPARTALEPEEKRPSIVEVADPFAGLIEIKVRDSRGTRIGFFQIDDGELDDELVEDIKAWQHRHSHELPVPKLVGE